MCEFCENKKFIPSEFVGGGLRTIGDMLSELCGVESTRGSGIKIIEDDGYFYLSYDNSADEYADGIVKINYCPMCGRNLKGEQT